MSTNSSGHETTEDYDDFFLDPLASQDLRGDILAAKDKKTTQDPAIGRRVGPFRVESVLGRGGMGSVYRAVREDGGFRQEVALKLVNWSVSSHEIMARFYDERQILANLQHPRIARLLDGGSTADGMPYFAMEFVDGEPVDQYCAKHRLSIEERLEIFCKICSAVHVAHQNLVVHRDLKPSNILVEEGGEPKLLDFGVAKLLNPELGVHSTVSGTAPMTPRFASPEQVTGGAITTATDVYSLGVLLYLLLTGRHPYHLKGSHFAELERVICSVDPKKPSVAVLQEEGTVEEEIPNTARASRRLSGDLDAIVLKALRKEPSFRYSTVADMVEDLHRHLNGLPVQARSGTLTYRIGKFVRRHRWRLIAAALVIFLSVGLAVREQIRLLKDQELYEKRWQFTRNILLDFEPEASEDGQIDVRQFYDRYLERIGDLRDEPEIYAEALATLIKWYREIGDEEQAMALTDEALEIFHSGENVDSLGMALLLNNVGRSTVRTGRDAEGEELYREALAMRERLGEGDHADNLATYSNLATALLNQGELSGAESYYRQTVRLRRPKASDEESRIALGKSLRELGIVLYAQGEYADAEQVLLEALELYESDLLEADHRTANILKTLGDVLMVQGRFDEADSRLQSALQIFLDSKGGDHPYVASVKVSLADLRLSVDRLQQARELIDDAERILAAKKGWKLTKALAKGVQGAILLAEGQYQQAREMLLLSRDELLRLRSESTYVRRVDERISKLPKETDG